MFWWRKTKQIPQEGESPSLVLPDGRFTPANAGSLIHIHGELHRRLRKEVDFEPEQRERYFDHLVQELAAYIQALPASEHGDHRDCAGLLGKCLRTAFLAQRIAHGKVVAVNLPADARSTAERSWRYAALMAGLIYPLGVLSHLTARGEKPDTTWTPEKGPLTEWCEATGNKAYRPYWQSAPRPHVTPAMMRLWMLSRLMTPERAAFITRETDDYLVALIGVLGETLGENTMLARVIQNAITKTRSQELGHVTRRQRGLMIEDRGERVKLVVNLVLEEEKQRGEESVVRRIEDQLVGLWPRFAQRMRVVAVENDILGFSEEHCDEQLLLTWLHEAGLLSEREDGEVLHPVVTMGKVDGPVTRAIRFSHLHMDPESFARARWVQEEVTTDASTGVSDGTGGSDDGDGDTLQQADDIAEVSAEPLEPTGKSTEGQGKTTTNTTPKPTPAQEIVAAPAKKQHRGANSLLPRLGELGKVLEGMSQDADTIGWWTQRGRALPWPEIARDAHVAPKQFLSLLSESGAAVRGDNRHLPFIHEVNREGKPRLVVIIARDRWGSAS